MSKINGNELRVEIAEILIEARKKKEKADKAEKSAGRAADAYGFYEEVFDHAEALGEFAWPGQTSAANWGPMTGCGTRLDDPTSDISESDERALRQVVREVIQIGIAPQESAWTTLDESHPQGIWEVAQHWYQKYGEDTEPERPKRGQAFEQTKYKLDRKAQRAADPKK